MMLKELIHVNQACYPERLSLAVVFCAPRVFTWVWRTIRGWIDVRTREKVHIMTEGYEELLLEHIDASMLEEVYGGSRTRPYPIPPSEDAS